VRLPKTFDQKGCEWYPGTAYPVLAQKRSNGGQDHAEMSVKGAAIIGIKMRFFSGVLKTCSKFKC
jgi:hypothetical protein